MMAEVFCWLEKYVTHLSSTFESIVDLRFNLFLQKHIKFVEFVSNSKPNSKLNNESFFRQTNWNNFYHIEYS